MTYMYHMLLSYALIILLHIIAPCIILFIYIYTIFGSSPPGRFLELTDAAAVVPMLPADRRSLDFGHQLKAKLKLLCQMTPMV